MSKPPPPPRDPPGGSTWFDDDKPPEPEPDPPAVSVPPSAPPAAPPAQEAELTPVVEPAPGVEPVSEAGTAPEVEAAPETEPVSEAGTAPEVEAAPAAAQAQEPEAVAESEPEAAPARAARRRPRLPAAPAVARRRLVALGLVLGLVAVGGVLLAVTGDDGDDAPGQEAGSRFGTEGGGRAGGTLLDALAPVLAEQEKKRTGAEPAPPKASDVVRNPADAVAGLFLVGFRGTKPSASFFRRLRIRPYGGVIISPSNFIDSAQLKALTGEVQVVARQAGNPAPLVAVAQEGGELNSLPGSPRSQATLGVAGARFVRADAGRAGRRLRSVGIGLNLAPTADIAVAGGPAQGRGFSDDSGDVIRATRAAVSSYRRAGVVGVVGHFPGEGAAAQDPTIGPAPVGLSLEQLRAEDMRPFEAVAKGRAAARAIQMSNAIYVAYDSVTPATLLADAVKELRSRIGFKGTIVSGDLVAATGTTGGNVGEAAVDALKAGVDLLVIPGGRAQQDEAYRAVVSAVRRGDIEAERVEQALRHIAGLRRFTRSTRRAVLNAGAAVPGALVPAGP